VSDNLVQDYLEEIKVISPDQFLDDAIIRSDDWKIYRISDDTLTYVRYELTGKLGYAFCVTVICKRLTIDVEATYYAKSYGNVVKEHWDIDHSVGDAIISNAISIIKPLEF